MYLSLLLWLKPCLHWEEIGWAGVSSCNENVVRSINGTFVLLSRIFIWGDWFILKSSRGLLESLLFLYIQSKFWVVFWRARLNTVASSKDEARASSAGHKSTSRHQFEIWLSYSTYGMYKDIHLRPRSSTNNKQACFETLLDIWESDTTFGKRCTSISDI